MLTEAKVFELIKEGRLSKLVRYVGMYGPPEFKAYYFTKSNNVNSADIDEETYTKFANKKSENQTHTGHYVQMYEVSF